MIEWTKLPRGTYRYTYNRLQADVWQVGPTWTANIFDLDTGRYVDFNAGMADLDAACEWALTQMKR